MLTEAERPAKPWVAQDRNGSFTDLLKKKIWFIFVSDVCHLLVLPGNTNLMQEIFYCILLQRGQNARGEPHASLVGWLAHTQHVFCTLPSHYPIPPHSRWHPRPQLTWKDVGTDFPFFLAMYFIIFMAFAFLFWEISHLGDSGMHLGYKGRGEVPCCILIASSHTWVSGSMFLREVWFDLLGSTKMPSSWSSVLP